MIKINYIGRLGNNMFQYSFGRILAEKMNYEMICSRLPYFNNAIILKGKIIEPLIKIDNNSFGNKIDNIIKLKDINGIELNGFFQQKDYYIEYIDRIRDWFYLPVSNYVNEINKNDIVLHIRRSDYKLAKSCIKLEYYKNILDSIKYDRVFICGDEFDDNVKNFFSNYNPIYFRLSEIEDIKFIKLFNKIIISNSTFAWWAAFLSNAYEIYYPLTVSKYFGPDSEQDLLMPNFIPIENVQIEN